MYRESELLLNSESPPVRAGILLCVHAAGLQTGGRYV